MKKIAWLLVAALLFSMMPVSTGMGEVQAANFVLSPSTEITSEHIPDETLLEMIKQAVGKSWNDPIYYSELANVTKLQCNEETTEEKGLVPIKSLEGLGYLTELSELHITGQNVTDLTPVGDCGNLRTLYANDNKITTMPNLTNRSMSACWLDRNHLSTATLKASFPTSVGTLETTCAKQLPTEPTVTASSKYYEVKDKDEGSYYPFVIAVEELRQTRNYTVSEITVDGTDYKDKFKVEVEQNYQAPWDATVTVSANAGEFLSASENHHIKVVIEDEYQESLIIERDFCLEAMQKDCVIEVEEPEYFSCTAVRQTGIQLTYKSFMTQSSGVTVQKVELTNQNGEVCGVIQYGIQSHSTYSCNDERYTDSEVRGKCYSAISELVGSSNICNIAFDCSSKMYVNTGNTIEPGFYNLVFTFSDGTTYTYRNAYEAVTRPIVYGIMDASESPESAGIMTDQTGDYVSVYVYGWNITKDTVTPEFYNGSQKISGEVAAVETGQWGAFFRIEKIQDILAGSDFGTFYSLQGLPTTDTEGDVWDIPLSTNSEETTDRAGYKTFDVLVDTEEEVFETKTQIIRREIYSQSYDQRNKTYTVYFAQEADVDISYTPTLTFETWSVDDQAYKAFVTVENGTFETLTNELTKQKEIKAKFVLNDDQIQAIKDNSTSYNLRYGVAYTTKGEDGEAVKFLSNYMYQGSEAEVYVEDVPTRGRINATGAIFYLPYWIGGVHTIAANGENSYYLTETDVQTLAGGKYAYADLYNGITVDNSSFLNRSWQYYFWEEGEALTPPTGTPTLAVTKEGESWKLSWNSISGATSYGLYVKYGDREELYRNVSSTYRDVYPEELTEIFRYYFEECYANPDESKMEIFVKPMVEKDGDFAYGSASNVLTVAGIRNSLEVHTHTKVTKITKANATKKKNGSNKTVCSECGETIKTNATYYYPKTVTVSTVTYNGKSQTPKVVVKDSKGKTISSAHYTVSKVKNVGTSTITITFKSTSKYYTGKLTAKCTVIPPKTALKSVTAGSKKLTVKWTKKTAGVTGYQIQYSTSKSFKGAKTVTVKKNTTTSTTIKKLSGKKKYYVRVRTYTKSGGKTYYSAWSSAKSQTTKK